MKYKIEKINNEYHIFEEIQSGGIDMNGKSYKPTEFLIDVCQSESDAKKSIDKTIQRQSIYDMNQITNYGG